MAETKTSARHMMIDKANATMLATIGVAAFIVTFSLVASKALVSQSRYQSRVIKEKSTTLKRLQDDNKNFNSLVSSYQAFAERKVNMLGGNPKGNGPKDGDNPKLVLDALPSKYDFPGLISSLEKLLKEGGYRINAIGGTDDELAQSNTATDSPTPIELPFPLTVTTDYTGAQNLLLSLERSIRPIKVEQLSITAGGSDLSVSVSAKTYYQPEKKLKVSTKEVQ
jgi:hypothetical protein